MITIMFQLNKALKELTKASQVHTARPIKRQGLDPLVCSFALRHYDIVPHRWRKLWQINGLGVSGHRSQEDVAQKKPGV